MAMRILIVDDHTLFLQGISALLEQHLSTAMIETYSNISDVYDALKCNNQVDLVLADIYMPKVDDKTLMELLNNANIFVPILLVSATEDLHIIKRSLDMGAVGFVHKSCEPKELINAITTVLKDGTYLEKDIAYKLNNFQNHLLSKRQSEVLYLLADGLSNRQIGEGLDISELTVKSHVSALFDFFDARNRLDCIRKAEKAGMVSHNNEYI